MSNRNMVRYNDGIVLIGTPNKSQVCMSALDTLKELSPTACSLISELGELCKGDKQLSIWHGPVTKECDCRSCVNNPLTNAYCPITNSILYTPLKCAFYDGSEPWMRTPPEIALGHELVHAYHEATGTYHAYGDMNNPIRLQEEARTVGLGVYIHKRYSENAIRKDYGLALRPRY